MPTYEYACTSCTEHVEVVQSFKDEPLTSCPACAGPLRKVFSPIGVVFKGSGFYKTDSRGSGPAKSAVPAPTAAGESAGTAATTDGGSATGSSAGSSGTDSSSSSSSTGSTSTATGGSGSSSKDGAASKPGSVAAAS